MVTEICVNFDSGNGVLPDGTKPLPEPEMCSERDSPLKRFYRRTSVAVNYRYRRYKSIWKFWSLINLDFSISIYRVSNFTLPIMSYITASRCGSKYQSGTKPNLVAKIWLPTLVSFLWCMECFHKYVQCGSNNDGAKYCGCGIPLNWDMSSGKFGGLPTYWHLAPVSCNVT